MINLLLSIIFSAYLVLAFKVFEKLKINIFHTIVLNYLACIITGCLVNQSLPHYKNYFDTDWYPYAIFLGCGFICSFNIMGYVTTHMGAIVTTVSSKLSLVIPVLIAFYLYDDKITSLKIIGIIISLFAVVLTSLKEDERKHKISLRTIWLPFILFVVAGIFDSVIKYNQVYHLKSNADFNNYNILIFTISFSIGFIFMLYDIIIRKNKFQFKSVVAGFLLGVPNYFSMYFLLKTLQTNGWDSSIVFPVNNICIVSLISLAAFIVFKEHLSKLNIAGLALAFITIILMAFAI